MSEIIATNLPQTSGGSDKLDITALRQTMSQSVYSQPELKNVYASIRDNLRHFCETERYVYSYDMYNNRVNRLNKTTFMEDTFTFTSAIYGDIMSIASDDTHIVCITSTGYVIKHNIYSGYESTFTVDHLQSLPYTNNMDTYYVWKGYDGEFIIFIAKQYTANAQGNTHIYIGYTYSNSAVKLKDIYNTHTMHEPYDITKTRKLPGFIGVDESETTIWFGESGNYDITTTKCYHINKVTKNIVQLPHMPQDAINLNGDSLIQVSNPVKYKSRRVVLNTTELSSNKCQLYTDITNFTDTQNTSIDGVFTIPTDMYSGLVVYTHNDTVYILFTHHYAFIPNNVYCVEYGDSDNAVNNPTKHEHYDNSTFALADLPTPITTVGVSKLIRYEDSLYWFCANTDHILKTDIDHVHNVAVMGAKPLYMGNYVSLAKHNTDIYIIGGIGGSYRQMEKYSVANDTVTHIGTVSEGSGTDLVAVILGDKIHNINRGGYYDITDNYKYYSIRGLTLPNYKYGKSVVLEDTSALVLSDSQAFTYSYTESSSSASVYRFDTPFSYPNHASMYYDDTNRYVYILITNLASTTTTKPTYYYASLWVMKRSNYTFTLYDSYVWRIANMSYSYPYITMVNGGLVIAGIIDNQYIAINKTKRGNNTNIQVDTSTVNIYANDMGPVNYTNGDVFDKVINKIEVEPRDNGTIIDLEVDVA